MASGDFSDVPGDTPLTDPPEDYCPDGAGSWFLIPGGRERNKRLFVRDSVHDGEDVTPTDEFDGDPATLSTVLFVHGNPECSYTYRQVIDRLAGDHVGDDAVRIVAPDHIGFGRSDTANYGMVCMDHARNLRQLVTALDLTDVTLVVHDWGGPIGVGALLEEPDRVANLVVLNSTVFPIPGGGRTFGNYPSRLLPWPRVPDLVPDGEWGELAADAVFTEPQGPVGVLLDLFADLPEQLFGDDGGDPEFEPPHVTAKRVFWRQFASPTNARSSKRLVRQCRYWAEGNVYEEPTLGERDTGPFYEFIRDSIAEEWGADADRDVGVRMVLGEWDPLAKDAVVEQWCDRLPQLRGNVERFPDRNHFIEEFEPGAVAAAIADAAGLEPS